MPEAAIAFGTCVLKNAGGEYASVGSVRLLDDGLLIVQVEFPDDDSRDMTIVWPANAVAGLLRLDPERP